MVVGGRAEAAVREWKRKYLRGLSRLGEAREGKTKRKVKGHVKVLSLKFKMTVSHLMLVKTNQLKHITEGMKVELQLLI